MLRNKSNYASARRQNNRNRIFQFAHQIASTMNSDDDDVNITTSSLPSGREKRETGKNCLRARATDECDVVIFPRANIYTCYTLRFSSWVFKTSFSKLYIHTLHLVWLINLIENVFTFLRAKKQMPCRGVNNEYWLFNYQAFIHVEWVYSEYNDD